MRSKIIVTFMCVAAISILTTGCLSTTQKSTVIGTGAGMATGTMIGTFTDSPVLGAALGAGAGAVGGALVGSHLDKKRGEQESAEIYRKLELEKQKSLGQGGNYIKGYSKNRLPKIPPGHMPPPGKCRIWFSGRPPGHQPPPGNCEVLERQVPTGAWLIRG